jgi:hypothetical protein
MRLPSLSNPTAQAAQRPIPTCETQGLVPMDAATVPADIALVLARDYSIDQITGDLIQCIGTINGILDVYQRCVAQGTNVGCDRIAARQIATIACRSYCTCGRSTRLSRGNATRPASYWTVAWP